MSEQFDMQSPISNLKGIGPKKKLALKKLGIETFHDLLYHFPREYRDLRKVTPISDLKAGSPALIFAKLVHITKTAGYAKKKPFRLCVEDRSGRLNIIFFQSGYLEQVFHIGEEFYFYGKLSVDAGGVSMLHPEYFKACESNIGGIEPIYPLTQGITQREVRKWVRFLLSGAQLVEETIPAIFIQKRNICSSAFALQNIHFPCDEQGYRAARFRLIYEELFRLQVALLLSRNRFGKGRAGIAYPATATMEPFLKTVPYTPTGAQLRVLGEVNSDMEAEIAMNRLVQGDVGSGKTLVAQAAIYKAIKSGLQAAMMAPTELLARQHYSTLVEGFRTFDFHIALLVGSMTPKEKAQVLKDIKSGIINVVVGTHAILSEGVVFSSLGLVITDEQHRFGVNQRLRLTEKGKNPDVLVMSATPIPRTLAVVLYGDLDISSIDEMPPGRQPVRTERFSSRNRDIAYLKLVEELDAGHQAYVVAPLIEDSDAVESRSADSLYKEIAHHFPRYSSALLHGNMRTSEKEIIMEKFYAGEVQILISTVVIEVGIDVPNATIILIENAERFGLAQLHQLRGRVGRGEKQSYCLIITDATSGIAHERAEVFCSTTDGFVIAEKDLELRGPGELFGFRQHGLPEFTLADPARHAALFQDTRDDALELLTMTHEPDSIEYESFIVSVQQQLLRTENVVL